MLGVEVVRVVPREAISKGIEKLEVLLGSGYGISSVFVTEVAGDTEEILFLLTAETSGQAVVTYLLGATGGQLNSESVEAVRRSLSEGYRAVATVPIKANSITFLFIWIGVK